MLVKVMNPQHQIHFFAKHALKNLSSVREIPDRVDSF